MPALSSSTVGVVYTAFWSMDLSARETPPQSLLGCETMRDKVLTIQDVEFPMPFARDPREFITPDWVDVVQFYPEFCRRVLSRDPPEEPWDPQPYVLTVAEFLERQKAREGRKADDWMRRMMEHFGRYWLQKAMLDMMAAKKEAMEGCSKGE